MILSFTQYAAKHRIEKPIDPDFFEKLPAVIRKHTGWNYVCQQRNAGCYLKPTFFNMQYRNSFLPEIDIVSSCQDAHTLLHISGQPVKSVRVFMTLWFGFLLMIEVFLLILAVTSKLDHLYGVVIPVVMGVFGYLLCKRSTKESFLSVVEAIQKEFP